MTLQYKKMSEDFAILNGRYQDLAYEFSIIDSKHNKLCSELGRVIRPLLSILFPDDDSKILTYGNFKCLRQEADADVVYFFLGDTHRSYTISHEILFADDPVAQATAYMEQRERDKIDTEIEYLEQTIKYHQRELEDLKRVRETNNGS